MKSLVQNWLKLKKLHISGVFNYINKLRIADCQYRLYDSLSSRSLNRD